jgi:sugar lactone lactonase YvrE
MKIIRAFHCFPAFPYNQPKFCPNASWNANAITFASISEVGQYPRGIFVDTNNTVYVADATNNRVQVWFNESINPTKTISGNLSGPNAVFVTTNGDIYVDNGLYNGRVDKWTMDANASVPAMYVTSTCYGLFVDINDTLYCSTPDLHQVVKSSLNDNTTTSTLAAGTGSSGSTSNLLNQPYGIFVDDNFDLYVADYGNSRIQLFGLGQLNATTVVGSGSLSTTISLNTPSGIVLDANHYLFIVDCGDNRIVGSGPNGFQCLVGCSGAGSASNQLYAPSTLSFDGYGNIFVTDFANNRVQKFILLTNLCGKYESI